LPEVHAPPRTRRRRPVRVEEPPRAAPRVGMRIGILGTLVVALFAVLFLRLWALQVISGSQYLRAAQNNQLRTVRIQAPRGPIIDRNGRPLVTNVAGTALEIWPRDLPRDPVDRERELRRLAKIVNVPYRQILREIGKRRGDPLTPATVKESAREAQVVYIYEHVQDFPGVTVARTFLRHYPHGTLAAQVLGYVTEVSREELKHDSKHLYKPGDEIGQTGVEAAYDSFLRGVPGEERLRVDSLGRQRGKLKLIAAPRAGHRLRLTLDLRLQEAAESALADGIANARAQGHWAADGGAIVALDPRNGAVLALASSPTYAPSLYSGRISLRKLRDAGLTPKTARLKNYPALDRAISGTYPPGSTFKPVTALAAMEEHVVSPYQDLLCTGFYKVAGQTFKNWDPNVSQWMTLPTALAASCDTYFYRLGYDFYRLPPERGHPLQAWAARFGFGSPTGIDLGPEERGLLPTPEWRRSTYTRTSDPCCWRVDKLWKPGDSVQLAIGQKDLLVTPLQMARFYALIANGGRLVTPHLLQDVEQEGAGALPVKPIRAPQPTGVDAGALAVVQQGLFLATHSPEGTSTSIFGGFPIPVAGKTGTAEKVVSIPGYRGLMDQSWWCGYAPADNPTLVVCALIENGGHGGSAAAPAALRVFEQEFHVQAVQTGPVHSD
jgi:penicillin-binding protein 2